MNDWDKESLFRKVKSFCAMQNEAKPAAVAEKFGIPLADAKAFCSRIRGEGSTIDFRQTPRRTFVERNYQTFILNYLTAKQGWIARKDKDFDRAVAMDPEMLIAFLRATQEESYAAVAKIYKAKADRVIVDALNTKLIGDGIIPVLKRGFQVDDIPFFVLAPKPEAPYNKKAWNDYNANRFTVAQEVWASDKERIDLVLFINGLPIAAIELKDNNAGQSVEDAKRQWQNDRSPKTRLFLEKGGVLVMFAVDLEQVAMTTKLDGKATRFLPFNKGCNAGHDDIDCGAGNPPAPAGMYAVHYLWEEILAKDCLLDIITRYVFVEKGEYVDLKGRKHFTEKVIFPRYHQLDCVTKLIQDVIDNRTKRNYLIQHSAGSGKTNSISWLAYRLASLFSAGDNPADDEFIFDHVIVMTDRRVVIKQLQAAVKQLENSTGYVKAIAEEDPSSELAEAFRLNKRIIATTIQRFAYIQDLVAGMANKRFAVIIDEAHSSTKGKGMIMVKRVLGADYDPNDSPEELMQKLMARQSKQKNVAMFAFTATPRAETIQLFGQHAGGSKRGVFHTYSMKQAIEEGFILDVLKNYTEYKTFYQIVKKTEDDPSYKLKKAKSQIAAFALSDPQTVEARSRIIVGHFLANYAGRLGGNAKAMVVTDSRQQAVAYWSEINAQLKAMGRDDVHAIVAFSGSLKYKGEKVEEHNLNGFSEDALPKEFRKERNRILVVADKYQTGFDQPFLSFMYVAKKLRDIAAVQTLSRLNRTCQGYDKQTFVLDFANKAQDIARSFALYYRSTVLNNAASSEQLIDAAMRIDQFDLFDDDDCNAYWMSVCKEDEPSASKVMAKVVKKFMKLTESDQDECRTHLARFDHLYPFVAQAVDLNDSELFRRDQLIHPLLKRLKNEPETPLDLRDKIVVQNVVVKEGATTNETPGVGEGVNLPKSAPKPKQDDLVARLSAIIEQVNSENSTDFPLSSAAKSCMLIHDQMLNDRTLAAIAAEESNTFKDFKLEARKSFEKLVSQAFTENNEFFRFILSHEDVRKKLLDGMVKDVHKRLAGGQAGDSIMQLRTVRIACDPCFPV